MPEKCTVCTKTVYALEKQVVGKEKVCHKSCFRCNICKRSLTTGSFFLSGDDILCQKHFQERRSDPEYQRKQEEKKIQQAEKQRKIEEEQERIIKAKLLRKQEKLDRINNMMQSLEKIGTSETSVTTENVENTENQGWQLSPTRFVATLSLDKPIYSTEDCLFTRAHFFDAHSLVPLSEETLRAVTTHRFFFEVLNAERAIVSHFFGTVKAASVEGQFSLHLPGGDYILRLTVIPQLKGLCEFGQIEREFSVQAYSTPPRFRKHLEFAQKGYGAGDRVCAQIEVKASDSSVSDFNLTATAQMNGNEFYHSQFKLDDNGTSVINLTMPTEEISGSSNSAILNVSIDDGSVTESISKTIPILKNNIEVKFYPEGGSVIEGLVNSVYVESFMNSEDPADIDAVIFEKRPQGDEIPIQRFHTMHEGRCKFSFTPKPDHSYRCEIIRPDVGNYEPVLPEILENGIVLHSMKNIFESDEDLSICVGSTNACILLAQVYKKEKLVYQEELHFSDETMQETQKYLHSSIVSPVSVFGNLLTKKQTSNVSDVDLSLYGGGTIPVEFIEDSFNSSSIGARLSSNNENEEEEEDKNPMLSHPAMKFVSFDRLSRCSDDDTFLSGIFRITISDKKSKTPFCERIVYRKCAETLQIHVLTDKPHYTEDDGPIIAVKVSRKNGTPVSGAIVSLSVVDDSILQMQEKRLQHPNLPAMVLLESDVKELRDAGVYLPEFLAPESSYNPEVLDLLLGVQGWRKFVFSFSTKKQQDDFLATHPSIAPALLSRSVISPTAKDNLSNFANYPVYTLGDFSDSSDESLGYLLEDVDDFSESFSLMDKKKKRQRRSSLRRKGGRTVQTQSSNPVFCSGAPLPPPPPPALPSGRISQAQECREASRLSSFSSLQSSNGPKVKKIKYSAALIYHNNLQNIQKGILTNAISKSGENGIVSFRCGKSSTVTQYRMKISCFDNSQALFGHNESKFINVSKNFFLAANFPLHLTTDDRLLLPIGLTNSSEDDYESCSLQIQAVAQQEIRYSYSKYFYQNVITHDIFKSLEPISLNYNTHTRKHIPINFPKCGKYSLNIKGSATLSAGNSEVLEDTKNFNCTVLRRVSKYDNNVITVVSNFQQDFPNFIRESKLLSCDTSIRFSIPDDYNSIEDSFLYLHIPRGSSVVSQYRNMIKEPHGCTEQIASSCYLMAIAIQQILMEGSSPEQFKALQGCEKRLESGFAKLQQMECSFGGFDWWSSADPHLGVTAFVVNVLVEMKSVFAQLEEKFIQSTIEWMMTQRAGNGRFLLSPTISSYGRGPKDVIEAYVLWVLTSNGKQYSHLKEELDFLFRYPAVNNDPYMLSLIAMTRDNVGHSEVAKKLGDRLASNQTSEGFLKGAEASIANSYGSSLIHETTSLAILAWLQIDGEFYKENINLALKYIQQGYGTSSTQATALAAKAKQKHFEFVSGSITAAPEAYEPFELKINGETKLLFNTEEEYYGAYQEGMIVVPLQTEIKSGENVIYIANPRAVGLYYYLDVVHTGLNPPSHPEAPIEISLEASKTEISIGENLAIGVNVSNREDMPSGMVVAQIGIPSGLIPNYKQLQESVKGKVFSFYEVVNGVLTIYWRGLLAKETKYFWLNFVAFLPGEFASSPCRVYPYYASEFVRWIPPLSISIKTKE